MSRMQTTLSETLHLPHGGALDRVMAAFPQAPTPWVDLSTGINPWAYPVDPAWSQALPVLATLPTAAQDKACRTAMARAWGCSPDAILVTPGTELLIRLLPLIVGARRIALYEPTYADHRQIWDAQQAEILVSDDPLALSDQVEAVVVCQPNNPDGRLWDRASLRACQRHLAAKGGMLIVDEAFVDLVSEHSLASHGGEAGLLVLRSFGKFYGLAGLRLGAVLAPADLRQKLSQLLGCWPVSGVALELGAQAYGDPEWPKQMRQTLGVARRRLDRLLNRGPGEVIGGTDLFRLVNVSNAEKAWRQLAAKGVYVRSFAPSANQLRFGLPRDERAWDRLEAVWNRTGS